MTEAEIKSLITTELSISGDLDLLSVLDQHWIRFADAEDDNLRYLLTKRATIRAILTRSRNKVDVVIGFDSIKHNQVVKNLEIMLKDLNDEIKDTYPSYSASPLSVSIPKNWLSVDE